MDVAQASSGCGREQEELASHVFEVIEVHSSDDFLESPVKLGWVRVRTCHVKNVAGQARLGRRRPFLRGLNRPRL